MTALLKEVLKVLKGVELPPEWTVDQYDNRAINDGYLFLKKGKDSMACIVDYHRQARAVTRGANGPLTLEKWDGDWAVLCDADTPKQVVMAFITFATFGAFK